MKKIESRFPIHNSPDKRHSHINAVKGDSGRGDESANSYNGQTPRGLRKAFSDKNAIGRMAALWRSTATFDVLPKRANACHL